MTRISVKNFDFCKTLTYSWLNATVGVLNFAKFFGQIWSLWQKGEERYQKLCIKLMASSPFLSFFPLRECLNPL